ncbi:hypothetical protein [Streptomyces purpurogeneiscleroticus]|uniref:hypothetical protein n=1 Tax=Streptomyces purpurogeneiscleroticus TaxID=68259 RepID=UPI001CC0810C|nr:hypothetical protein [Streptomyces purpurogeneiscleroticus]MBZ4017615.1 hypothetical protein [Streptomyces purpurogeneiscleroticus]
MSLSSHAASSGAAAVAAPVQFPVPLALGMPDRNSWLILIGFLVALVLLIWLLVRTVSRQGGFRRTCRRIAWEARMTARAFTAPLRAYLRHRRCARMLAAYFADPAAGDVVRAALDRADADAGEGCYVPAVQLSRAGSHVRVVVAGRDPAGSAGPVLPWTDAADEPGKWTWTASADAVRTRAAGLGRAVRLPLVLGVDRKVPGVVLVDWLRGPAALAIEGDARISRGVLQALAAQVDRMPDGPPVHVASGVHPRFPGRPLDDILAELLAEPAGRSAGQEQASESEFPDAAVPVVVCWAPTPAQAARLAELSARGQARVLAGGRLPGACWVLHAEPDGRLLGPGPQVDVESSALGRGVARAVRRGFPAPHCVLPDAGTGTGTGAGTGTDAGAGTSAGKDAGSDVPAAPELRKPELEPEPAPDRTEPVREQAVAGRPEPVAPPTEAARKADSGADFDEPAPSAPASGATAPEASAVPAPAQSPDAPGRPATPAPEPGTARGAAGSDRPADAGSAVEDGFDFTEPDLAEPRAAGPAPGLAGVSAASDRADADSDPAASGDPQERTPRTP